MSNPAELKRKFWTALADSPFLFLQLDNDPQTAVPMTAHLDRDADGTIWFFTHRDHPLAAMGPATATFAGKGHDMFARFTPARSARRPAASGSTSSGAPSSNPGSRARTTRTC